MFFPPTYANVAHARAIQCICLSACHTVIRWKNTSPNSFQHLGLYRHHSSFILPHIKTNYDHLYSPERYKNT